MDTLLLENGRLSDGGPRLLSPLDFRLGAGEHIVILGPNGSGKTTLVETLLGRRALSGGRLTYHFGSGSCDKNETTHNNTSHNDGGGLRYIAFHETYNRAEDGEYYYQQRWNSCDSDSAPRVGELLERIDGDTGLRDELYERLAIRPMLDKPVIMLSSGELRKFQIARMLLTGARVLVVDNPFIGLDVAARRVLKELLLRLSELSELQLILVLTSAEDIPDFVTHVYTMQEGRLGTKIPCEAYVQPPIPPATTLPILPAPIHPPLDCTEIVRLRGVTIRYGSRTILRELDWTLQRGEKWALAGPNGSGKSTLLSLISADNPQAYAQDIVLFGRQRGSGESIWDIKRRIGFVSSELHRSFLKDIPARNIVASGFFDSQGLYETPSADQLAVAEAWMATFGVGEACCRSFIQLSSGEQRLVLLARALVKDPALVILDEPLNGLDPAGKSRVKAILDAFCGRPGKTLIYVSHYAADLPGCIGQRLELSRND